MTRPGPLHAGSRSGWKSRLPQGRSDRSAASELGHRQPPGTNLLRGAAVQELALLAAFLSSLLPREAHVIAIV